MSVSGTPVAVKLIRFPGVNNPGEPTGSWSSVAVAIGDTSGGTIRAKVRCSDDAVGFRALFVPTLITVEEQGSAGAQGGTCAIESPNNRRLDSTGNYGIGFTTAVVHISDRFNVRIPGPFPWIECDDGQSSDIVVTLGTNTNSAALVVAAFGLVYDLEAVEQVQNVAWRGPIYGS